MKYPMVFALAAVVVFAAMAGSASAETAFEGRKKCSNCHKSEADSWIKTAHAKAVDSLKADRNKEKTAAVEVTDLMGVVKPALRKVSVNKHEVMLSHIGGRPIVHHKIKCLLTEFFPECLIRDHRFHCFFKIIGVAEHAWRDIVSRKIAVDMHRVITAYHGGLPGKGCLGGEDGHGCVGVYLVGDEVATM